MKIIQLLPELNGGGVERGTLELGKYLAERGHTSLVISHGGRLVPQLEAEGSRHIAMPIHKKSPASFWQVRPLRRLLEHERPDVIHLRSRAPAWIGWLAWRKMNPATRPRLITTVHGFYSVNRYSQIMTRGERVICVSSSIKSYVVDNYPAVPETKLVVVHRGVDPAEFPYGYRPSESWLEKWNAQYPGMRGKYVITLPGRITRWKGQTHFLKAIQNLKERGLPVCGLIVGESHDGKREFEAEIRQRVNQAGLENDILFTGHRGDLKEIMAVSDVVVSCSTDPEAFGRVSLEALSLGRPVAAYGHGGVAEQLDELLPEGKVPVGDIESLTETLARWRSQPPRPKATTTHPFTLKKFCDETLAVYDTELANRMAA